MFTYARDAVRYLFPRLTSAHERAIACHKLMCMMPSHMCDVLRIIHNRIRSRYPRCVMSSLRMVVASVSARRMADPLKNEAKSPNACQ